MLRREQKVEWISNTVSLGLCPNKIRIKIDPTVKALFNCSPFLPEKGGVELVIVMSTLKWIIKLNTPNFNSQSIVILSNLKQCLLTVAYRRLRCLKCCCVSWSERHGLLRICAILVSTQVVM